MLFDTNTNVYEDNRVNYIQESGAVFNIRGRKQKVLSKKEKEKIEQQIKIQIQRKAIQKKEAEKRNIAPAPVSFQHKNTVQPLYAKNEYGYTGALQNQQQDLNIPENLIPGDSSEDDEDTDLNAYFNKAKKAE